MTNPTSKTPDSTPIVTKPPMGIKYLNDQDEALLEAWRLYFSYSDAAKKQKNLYTWLRENIIFLGLMASILAVFIALPYWSTWQNAEILGVPLGDGARQVVRLALIALPIVIAGMMTFASEFTPNSMWIIYRYTAQRIMHEIFLYRMKAGEYGTIRLGSDHETIRERKRQLLFKIQNAKDSTDKLDSLQPYLQKRGADSDIVARVNKRATKDSPDNGFGFMTGDEYVQTRLIPNRDWYINSLETDYGTLRDTRIRVLAIAGLGSVAAGISPDWAFMIVITTAAVSAITTRTQLLLQGKTYTGYHLAASSLDARLALWNLLSPDEKKQADHLMPFVNDIEKIFRDEETSWMRQAIQSQVVAEQNLIKHINEWTKAQIEGEHGDNGEPIADPIFRASAASANGNTSSPTLRPDEPDSIPFQSLSDSMPSDPVPVDSQTVRT